MRRAPPPDNGSYVLRSLPAGERVQEILLILLAGRYNVGYGPEYSRR